MKRSSSWDTLIIVLLLMLLVTRGVMKNEPSAMGSVAARAEATAAQCERAAKAVVARHGVVETRPEFGFGNQVLSPEEIRVGETYVKCNLRDGDASVYTVTSEPYAYRSDLCLEGGLAVQTIRWDYGTAYPEQLFLTDAGVIPYKYGWNPVNVLLKLK